MTCSARIEKSLRAIEGVGRINVNIDTNKATVEYLFSDVSNFEAIPGHGIYSTLEEKTTMILAIDKKLKGIITVADTIKESSKEAIDEFEKMNIEVYH